MDDPQLDEKLKRCIEQIIVIVDDISATFKVRGGTDQEQRMYVRNYANGIKALSGAADVLSRLTAFLQGKPDSRPDYGSQLLEKLTSEQKATLIQWLDEAEVRKSGNLGSPMMPTSLYSPMN